MDQFLMELRATQCRAALLNVKCQQSATTSSKKKGMRSWVHLHVTHDLQCRVTMKLGSGADLPSMTLNTSDLAGLMDFMLDPAHRSNGHPASQPMEADPPPPLSEPQAHRYGYLLLPVCIPFCLVFCHFLSSQIFSAFKGSDHLFQLTHWRQPPIQYRILALRNPIETSSMK